jgi:site-specific recombinase XerD
LKNKYSPSSIKSYAQELKKYILYADKKDLLSFTKQDISDYINDLSGKNASNATINNTISSIKFFYTNCVAQDHKVIDLIRPIYTQDLPPILEDNEIGFVLNKTTNLKSKLLVALIYSTGCKVVALIKIKLKDIDSVEKAILLTHNSRKTRTIKLCNKVWQILREYIRYHDPNVYLFQGKVEGEACTERCIEHIIHKLGLDIGLSKNISPQILRNSYAVRCVELGMDLNILQKSLELKNKRGLDPYLCLAKSNKINPPNPLDSIIL